MSTIREIRENQETVKGVGDFATSLQQIAAGRMVKLRKSVLAAKRFADESVVILRELELERVKRLRTQLNIAKSQSFSNKATKPIRANTSRTAIIVITSDQGLCGAYNTEVFSKVEQIVPQYSLADYFVIGNKGQEFFSRIAKKHNLRFYPYNIPENVQIEDVRPLIKMFYRYDHIFLIFNRYINTTTREAVFIELAIPDIEVEEQAKEKEEGIFIFEPGLDELIEAVTAKLRYALFRQELLDSKLSLYTAQMIAMQTASENAKEVLSDLTMEYNKVRRRMIDKKIQEVQAGRSLWETN